MGTILVPLPAHYLLAPAPVQAASAGGLPINGNVQAAKRKAKGYRTKRNLKAIVYLIAGDVLASSPI